MKTRVLKNKKKDILDEKQFKNAILSVLDENSINYCPEEYEKYLKKFTQEKTIIDKLLFHKEDDDEN